MGVWGEEKVEVAVSLLAQGRSEVTTSYHRVSVRSAYFWVIGDFKPMMYDLNDVLMLQILMQLEFAMLEVPIQLAEQSKCH